MPTAHFGVSSELLLPDEESLEPCGLPEGEPLDDPLSAVRAALADPIGFPPLSQCVVDGDTVAIVLGENLNETNSLVAGAVFELLEAGIRPQDITVLRSVADAKLTKRLPTRQLPDSIADHVRVVVHEPEDREQLAMLNVSSDDQQIYLNRAVVDADFVLPIGTARPEESWGYLGSASTVYPAFADSETQRRFQKPDAKPGERDKQLEQAREALWFLGTRLIVQVVPGAGHSLMHVIAGDTEEVDRRSHHLADAIWKFPQRHRASIVVATLPGDRAQQSWSNVARALDAALRVVTDDGTVAICCDLKTRPGRSLRRLVDAHSLESVRAAVARDATPDAFAASRFVEALMRVNVFLLSGLDEESVQSLGLGYIATPEEVARLVARHDSCILLQNAHQAIPEVVGEAAL